MREACEVSIKLEFNIIFIQLALFVAPVILGTAH